MGGGGAWGWRVGTLPLHQRLNMRKTGDALPDLFHLFFIANRDVYMPRRLYAKRAIGQEVYLPRG
jgi:hypothetical protein